MTVRRNVFCAASALLIIAGAAGAAETTTLSLETIMANPDWIGAVIREPYWSVDGRSIYYSTKRRDSPLVDLHRVTVVGGKDEVVPAPALADIDAAAIFDRAGKRAAFIRNGDVFVRDTSSGKLTQLTRTDQSKASLQFSADGRMLSFRVGNDWFAHDFEKALTMPTAVLKAEKDPDAAPAADDLLDMQLRTFSTLKKLHDDKALEKNHAQEMRSADATRAPSTFYLGDDVVFIGSGMSPDSHWMVVVTALKSAERGKEGKLTRYVTESGYEEFETERLRVGRNPPAAQSLLLLDLVHHTAFPLSTEKLPGIFDDPLQPIREENSAATKKPAGASSKDEKPVPRGVWIMSQEPDSGGGGIVWSADSKEVAIQAMSIDNKDRWIVSVDLAKHELIPQHRLTDSAWINWDYNDFGWLKDGRILWFESEETGYAHLYTKAIDGPAHALTQGHFEVTEPALSSDGKWLYALSNEEAPYSNDVYRVAVAGGALQRLTHFKGTEHFALQQAGRQLFVTHSSAYVPAQIAVTRADGSGTPRDLTDTRTAEFKAMSFIEPEIVQVPSTHFEGVIYAKVYGRSRAAVGADVVGGVTASRPAVFFIHGAGYLQDVHQRYSYYFREQMFNNLLVQKGYVVIDMDYRASAGYGRNWRTAIYRQMGHPELDDLLDGKKWLVEHANVDPKRVGLYGGSYGGFMTLMGLLRAPEEFAAGAALRPVTDWMQYDHHYTSAILNDPQVDPIAYARSSPIEFAAALKAPLLICHGVIDDNVLFSDSIRFYERLIELHKENFTISPYPLDRHGFINADSWLDEYKRIYLLFSSHLQ